MARSRALRTVEAAQPLESLQRTALETQDGILLGDLIRRIHENDSPSEQRAEALNLIAKTHSEKTHVVIGCISALQRLGSDLLLPLCRNIINAPTNPDRDFIVAFAVETLVVLPSPERVDMLLLAKAVDHRSAKIQNSARRAVTQLTPHQLRAFTALTVGETGRPSVLLLRRLLAHADLTPLTLPPRPAVSELGKEDGDTKPAQREAASTRVSNRVRSEGRAHTRRRVVSEELPLPHDPFERINEHRLPALATATNSTIEKLIENSATYRELAGAMAEYTVRNGCYAARKFHGKLVYALSDPYNLEKARFADIAALWHRSNN